MPLETGKSQEAFGHNVAELEASGHPEKQAVAIAYKEKGEDKAGDTRKCAGILYVHDNHFLLLKRLDGRWDLPGGHLEPGESPLQGALRESQEEIGFKPATFAPWRLAFFNNAEVEYTIFCCTADPAILLNRDEHSAAEWFAFGSTPSNVHPNTAKAIDKYGKMNNAMDSARIRDLNGFTEIKNNPLSRVGVFPYLGRDMGEEFEPDKVYSVFRSGDELSRPETLESLKLIPFIDDHVMLAPSANATASTMSPDDKGIDGVIGEDVFFNNDTLYGNLRIFSDRLNERLSIGKRELSLGYRCRYKNSSGVWDGKKYDAIQTDIRFNHLALVDKGRMGPSVAVQDMQFTLDAKDLPMADPEKKDGEGASTEPSLKDVLAAVDRVGKDYGAIKGMMDKHFGKDEDADGDGTTTTVDADKDDKDAKDASEAEKEKKDTKDAMIAMDSALKTVTAELATLKAGGVKALLGEIKQRDTLVSRITPFVGTFDSAEMTLGEVQKYGIEKLGIKATAGHEQAALDGFLLNRTAPSQEVGFTLDHARSEAGANVVSDFYGKPN